MKYFLVLFTVLFGLLGMSTSLYADEDSARSARSTENLPASTSKEGEGALTNGAITNDMVKRNHKMDSVCQAEGNPDDCFDKTSAAKLKKKGAKKKGAQKKKLTPSEKSQQSE